MNIEKLKIKAEKGNLKAIRELGKIYYYGDHKKGTPAQGIKPKDPKKAFKWWQIGASKGDADCLTYLGFCYHMGDGTVKNNFEAKKCWQLASKKESSGASYNLGVFYENGWAVRKDGKVALTYYKENINKKNINKKNPYYNESLKGIARIYINGKGGVKIDNKEGIKHYKLAAKSGDVRAIFELANMYDKKYSFERYNGIKKDSNLAYKYYEQLSKKDFTYGHILLGEKLTDKIIENNYYTKKDLRLLKIIKFKITNVFSEFTAWSTMHGLKRMGFPRDVTLGLEKKLNKMISNIKKKIVKINETIL